MPRACPVECHADDWECRTTTRNVSLHGASPWHPRGPSLRQLLSCKREPPWDKPMASLRTTSPWHRLGRQAHGQRLGDVCFFPADFRRWGFVLRLLLAEDHIHTMRFSIV